MPKPPLTEQVERQIVTEWNDAGFTTEFIPAAARKVPYEFMTVTLGPGRERRLGRILAHPANDLTVTRRPDLGTVVLGLDIYAP